MLRVLSISTLFPSPQRPAFGKFVANVADSAEPSSISLPVAMTTASTWNTVWDLDASVAPADNASEAAVRVRAGVRVLLTQAERDTVCP